MHTQFFHTSSTEHQPLVLYFFSVVLVVVAHLVYLHHWPHYHRDTLKAMASSADSGGTGPPPEDGPGTEYSASPQGSVTSVKVAVRVRPLVSMETAAGCQECMFGDSDKNQARGREREEKEVEVTGAYVVGQRWH